MKEKTISSTHGLYITNRLREPLMGEIIQALHLPVGSQGLDVGCGIGLQALQLADAVGESGHVTGLDASASFLELAQGFARQATLSERISFRQGDWNELPFADSTFDWAWSADAAGYATSVPGRVMRELARVVKPAGSVIVLFWSSQVLLPGYPALEARLNATWAGIAPFEDEAPPETHYLRTLGWLREAGLVDVRAEIFASSVSAPLDKDLRESLTALFEMRWGKAETDLSPEDWQTYQRLCRADSPDLLLNRPDYYAFFTYSVFHGRRQGAPTLGPLQRGKPLLRTPKPEFWDRL